jgi:hypothetical protein
MNLFDHGFVDFLHVEVEKRGLCPEHKNPWNNPLSGCQATSENLSV